MTDELLTPVAVSDFLKTPERTLETWRYRGVGPAFIRLSGRIIRYRRSDLDRWLRSRRIGEAEEEPGGVAEAV